ncbi:fimbrial protein [Serratia fonticola]|uniref:CS1 type fimbrial major subunit n=1 Tax=Serratia fonticola TaxID=47917 RepID=UPI0020977A2D|nr:CS1 type fimbrial major subunit [Serratia fonticola]MCO7509288.1 fimbrial protein [Serratia fonticola]
MKKILLSVVAATILASSMANAAPGINKKISIVATINDAIFVSKPDGSTWYDTEELFASDRYQTTFASNDLPVRIYSTTDKVDVTMVQPLTVSRADSAQLDGVKVTLGGKELSTATAAELTQTTPVTGGFDNTYTLKITADAPTNVATGISTNGDYQGDLVMLFEPMP